MLGICQWFHYEDEETLDAAVRTMADLGVRRLRTGISWADHCRERGPQWYTRQMRALAAAGLDVLLSVWHTPPSFTAEPSLRRCSLPPSDLGHYARFIEEVIDRYGGTFSALELWNEPNNPYKWGRSRDPDCGKFARMVIPAAESARRSGVYTVLGGMTMLEGHWMEHMRSRGVFDAVDAVGIHAFPGMWRPHASDRDVPGHWHGWDHRIRTVHEYSGKPVWVTETGLATWSDSTGRCCRYGLQALALRACADVDVPVYWYSLFDLPPWRDCIEVTEGGAREESEYHMGLIDCGGNRKPAYAVMKLSQANAGLG